MRSKILKTYIFVSILVLICIFIFTNSIFESKNMYLNSKYYDEIYNFFESLPNSLEQKEIEAISEKFDAMFVFKSEKEQIQSKNYDHQVFLMSERKNSEVFQYNENFYVCKDYKLGNYDLKIIGKYRHYLYLKDVSFYLYISFIFSILLVGYFYLNFLLKEASNQLKQLGDSYKNIFEGNYDNYLYLNGFDEITDIARLHNDWIDINDQYKKKYEYDNNLANCVGKSINSGILIIDPDKNIVFSNTQANNFLKRGTDKILNREYHRVIAYSTLLDGLDEAFSNEVFNPINTVETVSTEEIYACTIQKLMHQNQFLGILITIVDITEKEVLSQSKKELMDNLSHELRTPLTSIIGFIETMLEGNTTEEVRERFLKIIFSESQRLYGLIEEITQLTKIEKSEKKRQKRYEFNPYDSIKTLSELLKSICSQREVDFKLEINNEMNCQIFGSETQFNQLLINLTENAAKYHGSLDPYVKVKAYNDELYLYIEVEDNGIGIDKRDQKRIFERFYQVDKVRNRSNYSSGLGLSIVKHIVLGFHGEIILDSEINRGSTFTIKIPVIKNVTL